MLCMYCMNEMDRTAAVCPHCGKSREYVTPPHRLMPGTVLAGRYIVGVAKGEGGFGITYTGKDTRLERLVAIKEYFPSGLVNRNGTASPIVTQTTEESGVEAFERGRERFLNEARTLAMFSGEMGIVNILDFFEENNTAYIVMEYLDGVSLNDYLKTNGIMSPEDALTILMPIMLSLKKIHKQGLIHRDISPSNIMVLKNTVKLIDFGAARHATGTGNKSISLMLKPGYAPEEQYRSKGVQGPWTDVYALCATIYKCITGVTPDEANDRLHNDELRKPSELGANVSPAFEAALLKGMSILQQDRYQSIDELLADINSTAISDTPKTLMGTAVSRREPQPEDDNRTTMVSQMVGSDDVTRFVPRQTPAGSPPVNQAYRAPVMQQQPAAYQQQPVPGFGAPQPTGDIDRKVADRIKKRRRKNALVAFIVILLLALVTVLVLVLVKNSSKGGSKSSSKMDKKTASKTLESYIDDSGQRYVNFYKTAVTVDHIKAIKQQPQVHSIYITKCEVTQGAIDEIGELSDMIEYLSIEESKGFDDLKALSKLKKLSSLAITMCGLKNEDFNKIDTSSMTKLSYVDLSGNPDFTDLSFLKSAQKTLSTLTISYTAVSDISMLSGCERLYSFKAEQCKLSDLSPLKGLPVSYLNVPQNQIKDLSPLQNAKNLRNLDIASNQVESLQPLSSCGDLINLNANHNKIKSLAGLEKVIRLEKLECAYNEISDLSGITNCTVLSYVNISGNKISDISLLSKSASVLKVLFLDENQVSDLSPVSKATGLKCISFNSNKITSIDALKDLTKLTAISGDSNTIQDLSAVQNMTGLTCLSFAHNKITDMTPVEKMTQNMKSSMYVLDLSNNNISTLSLASGKTYESVLIYSNPINSLDNVKNIKGLTIAISYFEGIKLAEIKNGYFRLSIIDCPLDKQVAIEKEVGRYAVTFSTSEEKEKDTKKKKESIFGRINA